MAAVSFRRVNRSFAEHHAVRDLDLEIADGEFMILVGPSGCGKTTALRMTAGLEEISSGEIAIDATVVNDLDPQRRDVAMVFQEYALYPQMTVFDNIAFALKLRKAARSEIDRRVRAMAEILGIEDLLQRRPRQLSGGQRQRVAMGRALVRDPKVFLMDEPLSNLDAKLRVQMRYEVSRIQRELGTTTIFVTHDQVEALTMGTRVAVMQRGRLQQVDTPQALYDRPVNMFVAAFIGSPEMNLLRARIETRDGAPWCVLGEQALPLPAQALSDPGALARLASGEVVLGLRPEGLEDAALGRDPGAPTLRGRAATTETLGAELLVHVELPGAPVLSAEEVEADPATAGAMATTTPVAGAAEAGPSARGTALVGRFDPASRATPGEPVELAVDLSKAHLFDPVTHRRL